ncbi:MAG: PglZ domain-containing protein [Anaerolineae bacterium]|nr:MAG: PglZ domain-containing protein [Anaerolineae bacterium]
MHPAFGCIPSRFTQEKCPPRAWVLFIATKETVNTDSLLHNLRSSNENLSSDDLVLPAYRGGSILNILASICRWLNLPPLAGEPLTPEVDGFPAGEMRRVMLVLMDALALHRFQQWLGDGLAPVWRSLQKQGFLAPLTSIIPSTTSAATTTLWTGVSAAVHGIAGYELWLKEYGIVSNMIFHAPMAYKGVTDDLSRAGFEAENFVPAPTLGPHLLAHGVTPYAFIHRSIARSGLSRMQMKDVKVHSFLTPADLWISLRHLLEARPEERQYIWVYWGAVDGLSHHHSPDNERTAAEFDQFSRAMENFFLKQLSPTARQGTLLVLTADHGQIYTPNAPRYNLQNHPELEAMLHIRPTGENRLIYLHIRPGKVQAVRDYFAHAWPGDFTLLTSEEALAQGLFGPGEPHADLGNRLGDLIAIARGKAYLWWGGEKNPLRGRHGGLHPHEMLVPFLVAPL